MFSFTKEQHVVNVSGIHIGGQPGTYPTVLIGGLFFKGELEFSTAQKHLHKMYDLSTLTGIPAIPDFFIRKESYIENIIAFIKQNVPEDFPFSIDIVDPSIKIIMLKHLHDEDLLSRTLYNSIHIGITQEEKKALEQFTPAGAILVAFNPKDKSPDGKIEVLENGAHLTEKGLLDVAKTIGIKNILVDTAALAPGENSGAAIAAIPVIKEEYGFPTGCAIHNVVEKSKWLQQFGQVKKIVDASSNIAIPLFGGDFAIFGPVENADMVFPIIAWHDILVSEYCENYFGVSPVESHPRRKFLK